MVGHKNPNGGGGSVTVEGHGSPEGYDGKGDLYSDSDEASLEELSNRGDKDADNGAGDKGKCEESIPDVGFVGP